MRLSSKIRALLAGLFAAGLLVSCQLSADTWLVEGSTAEDLVFGISDRREDDVPVQIHEFVVYDCAQINGGYPPDKRVSMWANFATREGEPPVTNRVAYGMTLGTLRVVKEAEALRAPGCYVIWAAIRGRYGSQLANMGFKIDEDGTAIRMSRREYDAVFD